MKKLIFLLTSLIFCLCFIAPVSAEENLNDNISAFKIRYDNIEKVTITQNGEDVTEKYIDGFVDAYQSGEEDKIDAYINSNNLNISVNSSYTPGSDHGNFTWSFNIMGQAAGQHYFFKAINGSDTIWVP